MQITDVSYPNPKFGNTDTGYLPYNAQNARNYPNDSVEIHNQKNGLSNGAKVGIGLGIASALALFIGLVAKKSVKSDNITKNLPDLKESFSQIYKKDFSEDEIKTMSEKYKEIFKIDDVDEFANKLFEQVKKDSGNENKKIDFIIKKCEPGTAQGGGFNGGTGKLDLDIECENNIITMESKKIIFEALVHEFTHVRQYEKCYHTDSERLLKILTKNRSPEELIEYMEDALRRNSNELDEMGGEEVVKEMVEGLKNRDPEVLELFKRSPEFIEETKTSFERVMGPVKQYDVNSEDYKIGLKYLENWDNYIQPVEGKIEQYRQQIVEKEAYDAQDIAAKILKLLGL